MLLSRLDLSSRRPAQGGAAAARLSARFRSEESEDRDGAGAARYELSRLRVRQRSGRRAEPGRFPRLHDDLARRHGRSRAGRRDRGRRRRVQARLRRQLEALSGKPLRRRASLVHPPLLDRSRAAAVGRGVFRRLRRDRDPPDAAERRALQLLGIAGRHLDLSQRPFLSRRLSRRCQAGRRAQGPVVPRLHRRAGKEEGQAGNAPRAGSAALEQQRLSEPVVHEPVPAIARGASDRRRPHRRPHLQFPPQGRAGADVPQHDQLRQHRQRHRLAGADRRSGNLQPHRHGAYRAQAPNGSRSAAACRATCPMRMAAGAARIRPAKSISAT